MGCVFRQQATSGGATGAILRLLVASSAALTLATSLMFVSPVRAQDNGIIRPGSAAVTGFSGTHVPGLANGPPANVDPIDETFIDPERATLRIFDAGALGGSPSGQVVFTPPPFEVLARQIGQVFALTYDDGKRDSAETGSPNLYAGASSLHGLRIVTPDEDGDGRPERQRTGKAGATFMEGQFAENNGGSPGAIWKIDGASGAVSLFATIDGNSGPGIGDLAFDSVGRQFFASDLDTGLIHRIGVDGRLIDTFDHGVAGRPAGGLAPVADDGAVMDIESSTFDSEDPRTWGFTRDERRVWAVAAHGDRIYYAVGNRAEIWSVGLNRDGSFAGDARREVTVKAHREYPVTDIAFDSRGFMYLAQRGDIVNHYDYSQFADSGDAEVIQYRREGDDPATESVWAEVPQEHAVGFSEGHRQAAGGIDLQYGYDSAGRLDRQACGKTLVRTGDRLRENPALEKQLGAGGPLTVHGVQIATSQGGPASEPPFDSWFVDFDGLFEDPDVEGQVGDVEVWHPCEGDAGYREEIAGGVEAEKKVDLTVRRRTGSDVCSPDGVCTWIIDVINSGTETITGPLTVTGSYPTGSPASSDFGPVPPWRCSSDRSGLFRCDNAGVALVPGASIPIVMRTAVVPDAYGDAMRICSTLASVPGENDLANNGACAEARFPRSDPGQPSLKIAQTCNATAAGGTVSCRVTVISDGTAAPAGPVRVADAATVLGASTPIQIQTVTPDGSDWTCSAAPASTLSCQVAGAVMPPGTSRHFDVTLTAPPAERFENCARAFVGQAPGDDVVRAFGRACVQGGADIQVEQTGDLECEPGQPCTFEITIRNEGDVAFNGTMRIGDAMEVEGLGRLQGVAIAEVVQPFGCAAGTAALPFACEAELPLAAGASRVHQMTVIIPHNAPNGVAGRNCVAVLRPGTPVIGAGGMARGSNLTDGGGGKAFDCHEFRIGKPKPEPVKECPGGFVLDTAGRCVCPEGTTLRDGQCLPERPKDPEPEQCTLLPGMILTGDGRCICPRGTVLGANGCFTPPAECRLLPGMIRTQDGQCVCPLGTEIRNGACRKVEEPQCKLLPGMIRTQSGQCVCPRGTELSRGACRKVEEPQCKLLPGMIRTQRGECVCPKGTELRNGACREVEEPQCRLLPGMIRTQGGECVCPRGTELSRGACRTVEQPQCKLLPGMIRTKRGECVCPKGTELSRGACRKVEQDTPGQCTVPGQVKLKSGRCACPVRTELRSGACRKIVRIPGIRKPNMHLRQPQPRNPVIRQPVTRDPVVKQPVTRDPVVKQPVTRDPVVKRKPVVRSDPRVKTNPGIKSKPVVRADPSVRTNPGIKKRVIRKRPAGR